MRKSYLLFLSFLCGAQVVAAPASAYVYLYHPGVPAVETDTTVIGIEPPAPPQNSADQPVILAPSGEKASGGTASMPAAPVPPVEAGTTQKKLARPFFTTTVLAPPAPSPAPAVQQAPVAFPPPVREVPPPAPVIAVPQPPAVAKPVVAVAPPVIAPPVVEKKAETIKWKTVNTVEVAPLQPVKPATPPVEAKPAPVVAPPVEKKPEITWQPPKAAEAPVPQPSAPPPVIAKPVIAVVPPAPPVAAALVVKVAPPKPAPVAAAVPKPAVQPVRVEAPLAPMLVTSGAGALSLPPAEEKTFAPPPPAAELARPAAAPVVAPAAPSVAPPVAPAPAPKTAAAKPAEKKPAGEKQVEKKPVEAKAAAPAPVPAAKAEPVAPKPAPEKPAEAKNIDAPVPEAAKNQAVKSIDATPAAAPQAVPPAAPAAAQPLKEVDVKQVEAKPPVNAAETPKGASAKDKPWPAVPLMADLTMSFDRTSSTLSAEGQAKLDALAAQMHDEAGLRLQVRGYAMGDAEGQSSARRMSLSRALMVRSYLIDKGIKPVRIDVRALGSDSDKMPIDRVDLVFVR